MKWINKLFVLYLCRTHLKSLEHHCNRGPQLCPYYAERRKVDCISVTAVDDKTDYVSPDSQNISSTKLFNNSRKWQNWTFLHRLFETREACASRPIMSPSKGRGDWESSLISSVVLLSPSVPYWSDVWRFGLPICPMMPGGLILSDGYTPDRCRICSLGKRCHFREVSLKGTSGGGRGEEGPNDPLRMTLTPSSQST